MDPVFRRLPQVVANEVVNLESKTLEFKRDFSSPQPILKTVVAFANSAGGQILIGVEDNHRVSGLHDPARVIAQLDGLTAQHTRPPVAYRTQVARVEGRDVVVITVPPSANRPHRLHWDRDMTVYVRVDSSSQPATANQVADMQRRAAGRSFDQMVVRGSVLRDLDTQAVRAVLGSEATELETLRSLGLASAATVTQGELTNAGVLLFGRTREELFPYAKLQCGVFAGADKTQLQERTLLRGHLPLLPDSADRFLTQHTGISAEIRPLVRELILNALVHSDYEVRDKPLRLSVFDERIEIESLGTLLPKVTLDMLREGRTQTRNPVISRIFRLAGLVGLWGGGVPYLYDRTTELGLPEPEVQELPNRLRVTLWL